MNAWTEIGRCQDGQAVKINPARLIGTRMLVQANSGGGKSWMLRVLCERLGRETPLIVLDWEGEFASLREKLDVLLVGRDGEIPTAVATAGALATQVLEIGVSAVIDLYDLKPQDKRAYVRRFLESLMAAPRRLWSPRLVIVDEAHVLAPEQGDAESADAVKELASAGRKRQFCAVLATQRLSKLHKDAAAELNNVLIGRTTLDVDQKRAGDVLGMHKADAIKLRERREGEFYGFGPAFNFDGVRLFKSADVTTTHGARAGEAARPPEPSAKMKRAVEQLRDLAERAKTEVLDLDTARATIRDLRKQLAAKPAADPEEVSAMRARCDRLSELVDHQASTIREFVDRLDRIRVTVLKDTLVEEATLPPQPPQTYPMPAKLGKPLRDAPVHTQRIVVKPAAQPARQPVVVKATSGDNGTLPVGERKTLAALIQYPHGLRREQLTVLTAYKRSTRDRYLQRLREKGYVDTGEHTAGRVLATEAGRAAIPDAEPLPTGEALRDYWLTRLPEGERAVLQVLIDAHPDPVTRERIDAATGYKRSTRDRYLQRLESKELVTTARSTACASDTLFEE